MDVKQTVAIREGEQRRILRPKEEEVKADAKNITRDFVICTLQQL